MRLRDMSPYERIAGGVSAFGLGWGRNGFGKGGSSGGASGPSSYMGQIGTRSQWPHFLAGPVFSTWSESWTTDTIRDATSQIKLVFTSVYLTNNTNTETLLAGGTVSAAIEYPVGSGTIVACNEGTVSFSGGFATLTCNITVPKDAAIRIGVLHKNANGMPYVSTTGVIATDRHQQGTGSGPSTLTAPSGVSAATNALVMPVIVASMTKRPSVALHHDSRETADGDTIPSTEGYTGALLRGLGPSFGVCKMGVNGARIAHYLVNNTYRQSIMAAGYFSHEVDSLGYNDRAFGRTAAQVATDRTALAALNPGVITIGATCYNATTSTDSWATLANQTVAVNDPQGLNALILAGISGESAFVFDLSGGLDPTRTGKFPVTGAANYATTDGVHLTTAGTLIIIASGAINPAWVFRGVQILPTPIQANYIPSQDISSAGWTKGATTASSATDVRETVANSAHTISRVDLVRTAAAKTFVLFVDVEMVGGRGAIVLQMWQGVFGTATFYASFDTATGAAVFSSVNAPWTNQIQSIKPHPDHPGRYRCQLQFTTGASDTNGTILISVQPDTGTASYAGDPTKGFNVYSLWLYNKFAGVGGS